MKLYQKSTFLSIALLSQKFYFQFIYYLKPDFFRELYMYSPRIVIFQGFQISGTGQQFNIFLPGCSNLEKFCTFFDLFGKRHQLIPIFSSAANAQVDFITISKNYFLLLSLTCQDSM